MLGWLGEILFATCLGIIVLIIATLLQQPSPQLPIPLHRHSPSPSPPPSPIPSTMTTQSPYDEATIVSLINEYYSFLVTLSYLKPSQIIYPDPDSGHNINEVLCKQLGIDAIVISLMKKLPYIDGPYKDVQKLDGYDEGASAYGCMLFPGSMAYSFLRDLDIMESRDPEYDGVHGLRLNYLLSHDVALSHNLRDGMSLLLDTKANTVRMLDSADGPDYVNPEGWVLERPEEPLYYRNYYTQDAPSYFRSLNEKIHSLQLIPEGRKFSRQFHGDEHPGLRDRVKKILTEQYGWPGDFRQEDWIRDADEVWNKVIHDFV